MAYTNFSTCTANEYKQVIYNKETKNRIRIWFNNIELQDADEYCVKFEGINRIIPDDGKARFSLSYFYSRNYELVLRDLPSNVIIADQVRISIGTIINNNTYEDVPIGIFNIQEEPKNDKGKITIKLKDNRVKFDFGYNAKPLIDSLGGSATLMQILNDICTKAGVTNKVLSFNNDSKTTGLYDSSIKASAYVSYIAEQAGLIATIDRDGGLIFVDLSNASVCSIPLGIVEKYEIGTPYQIDRVVYESGVIKYETSSDITLDTLYLDGANPYITTQQQVNDVLTLLGSFEIDSATTGKILGNPALDSYDLIQIYDEDNNDEVILTTLATNTFRYSGKMLNTFDTEIGKEERKENVTVNSEETFRKSVKTEIDDINGELALKVEQDGVISAINLSSESATINANKISLAGKNINLTSDNISISSNNFSVSSSGNITATGGDIGGFHIGQDSLWNNVEEYADWVSASGVRYKYNMDDAYGAAQYSIRYGPSGTAPQEFLEQYGFTTTAELLDKWDTTLDGGVRINDVMKIATFVENSYASNISLNAGQSGSPANIVLGGVHSTEAVKITSLGEITLKDDYDSGNYNTKELKLKPTQITFDNNTFTSTDLTNFKNYDGRITNLSTDISNLTNSLTNSINALYHYSGESVTLGANNNQYDIILNGLITSDSTDIYFNITTPKKMDNVSGVSITSLSIECRGIKGYLNSQSGYYEFVGRSGYTIYTAVVSSNQIGVKIIKSSAWGNATNNTPISLKGRVTLYFY